MSRSDELRAELEMAHLEEQLAEAKDDTKVKPDKLAELKQKVRAARQSYRQAREG